MAMKGIANRQKPAWLPVRKGGQKAKPVLPGRREKTGRKPGPVKKPVPL